MNSTLVDNKKCLCQHGKLYPLKSRKGTFTSETMYIDIEVIILQDSHKYITPQENKGLTT